MSAWEFESDTKWAGVVVCVIAMITVLGLRSCASNERSSLSSHQLQTECLRTGHTVLECKELR